MNFVNEYIQTFWTMGIVAIVKLDFIQHGKDIGTRFQFI